MAHKRLQSKFFIRHSGIYGDSEISCCVLAEQLEALMGRHGAAGFRQNLVAYVWQLACQMREVLRESLASAYDPAAERQPLSLWSRLPRSGC